MLFNLVEKTTLIDAKLERLSTYWGCVIMNDRDGFDESNNNNNMKLNGPNRKSLSW